MTHDRDIARLLDAWLAEGPLHVPDRTFDDAVARLRRQPQRRAWRLPWRSTAMPRPYLYAAAAVVLIAVAFAGYQLLPRASGPGAATPKPSITPSTNPVPPLTPASSPGDTPTPGPVPCVDNDLCLGRLVAGTYTTSEPVVPFRYTVPDGWQNFFNSPAGYGLQPQESGPSSPAAMHALLVFSDLVAANQACTRTPEPGIGRSRADLVAWLATLPEVDMTAPVAVTVGGLEGVTFDLSFSGSLQLCGGEAKLWVSADPGMWWGITAAVKERVTVLDRPGGGTVFIIVEVPAEDFDAFAAAAQPIVDSFDFTP